MTGSYTWEACPFLKKKEKRWMARRLDWEERREGQKTDWDGKN